MLADVHEETLGRQCQAIVAFSLSPQEENKKALKMQESEHNDWPERGMQRHWITCPYEIRAPWPSASPFSIVRTLSLATEPPSPVDITRHETIWLTLVWYFERARER